MEYSEFQPLNLTTSKHIKPSITKTLNKSTLLFLSIILMLCGCGKGKKNDTGWKDSIGVEVLVVSSGINPSTRDYVGEVGSEAEVDLAFPLGGTLTKLAVHNGQYVRKGDVLAEVDGTTAKSLHNTALATLRQAEDAYNRLQKVHEEGGISDVRWIQMATDLEKAKQSEIAARQRVEQSLLKAPFDGIVSCPNRHVGQDMKPLESFGRLIDLGRLRIGFSVPEQEIGLLAVGSEAVATIPSLDNRELRLRISDKSLLANPMGHTYKVYGTIVSGKKEGLLPDMVAKVRMDIQTVDGIVIPAKCVQTMPEGTIVWVVNGGRAYHRLVMIREFVRSGVLVESGLEVGDTVVTAGQQKLYTGAKVEL